MVHNTVSGDGSSSGCVSTCGCAICDDACACAAISAAGGGAVCDFFAYDGDSALLQV